MPFASWLRSQRPQRRAPSSQRWFRPHLLELEDRTVPSILTVTNFSDHDPGSLRQELQLAQNGDLINFDPSLGSGTITLTTGVLTINHSVTIAGPGANQVTISGNDASEVLQVNQGSTVTISGLTIAHGNNLTAGGIGNSGTLTLNSCTLSDNIAPNNGGGIGNSGTLTLNNCTLSDNVSAEGGAISNFATLNIWGCTFSGNSATSTGDPNADGGAIANLGYFVDAVTIRNSTFSGNSASSQGGAIYSWGWFSYSNLTVVNSTISGNSAHDGGGIYSFAGDTTQLLNTIVAGNTATGQSPDVHNTTDFFTGPTVTSLGHNLIGVVDASSSGVWVASDLTGTADAPLDPRLGPLANNGGPTQTMALLAGSPALNAGDPAQLGTADQRGVVRTGGVNIGAYQASASAFLITAPATATAGVPFDVTVTAVDTFGQTAVGYTGTVTFRTTDLDPGVLLPADYAFTLADGGVHTFTNTGLGETTLLTPGDQTLTVTDTSDNTITGSTIVTVNSPAAPPAGAAKAAAEPASDPAALSRFDALLSMGAGARSMSLAKNLSARDRVFAALSAASDV